jgi:hypothetical protein
MFCFLNDHDKDGDKARRDTVQKERKTKDGNKKEFCKDRDR